LTKDEALELFKHNCFKVSMITNKIPNGSRVTAYKCGPLIDLCTGPHIPSTTMIQAFRIEKNSSAYWLGKAGNDSLQRVYGITFPDKKLMQEHIHFQEEARKRDHRTIGQRQDLFHINDLSPGCPFFYPKGMIVYSNLMNLIREQYKIRGYHEVQSPNLFNLNLWKTSGHYTNYKDNIFIIKGDDGGFGVKPMNCPAHCLIFA
jgi:threonyl-tRNA synthetase